MLSSFQKNGILPKIEFVQAAGPVKILINTLKDRSKVVRVGEWQFQPIPNEAEEEDNYLEQTHTNIKKLLNAVCFRPVRQNYSVGKSSKTGQNREAQDAYSINQYINFIYPGILDPIGSAILEGKTQKALELYRSCTRHPSYEIFETTWVLENHYQHSFFNNDSYSGMLTKLIDKKLIAEEEVFIFKLDPVSLAMMSGQELLAVQLHKLKPTDIHHKPIGFGMSFVHLAKELNLTYCSSYFQSLESAYSESVKIRP